MGPDAWLTLVVLGLTLGAFVFTRYAADLIMVAALTMLLVIPVPGQDGWHFVLPAADALHGLANEGVWTIGVLFIVAAGLRDTGGMAWIAQRLLGRPKSLPEAQARIMIPMALMSAFMNNTPLVAMMMPVVSDWSKKCRLAASKLFIPLSFASIFGGACTLIGTSTNLIINGWLIDEAAIAAENNTAIAGISPDGLGMFEVALIGLPVAVMGLGFILLTGRFLLPDRKTASETMGDPREYTVEMLVEAGSPLVGKGVEEAGLRSLPGAYLAEIDRAGQVIAPVGPTELLAEGDRLVFFGVVESVVDLQKIRGLSPATDQVFKLDAPRSKRCLIEAVVSDSCPARGRTIREARFRTVYNAAVIAVHRNGQRINRKIGDIVLQAGDTLLIETTPTFVEDRRNSRDFYLVSRVEGSTPPRHELASLAVVILGLMVAVVTLGWLSMLQASMIAAGLMVITRCTTASAGRDSVDWSVLLVIAAALGLGKAMENSGLAEVIGTQMLTLAGDNPHLALASIYVLTMVLAALVTSKAAAVLVLPVAMVAASPDHLGVSLMPFVMAILIASATTIATPIGYPTNLMVYGPGGYRFADYLRIGVPLSIVIAIVSVLLIPVIWPFAG